MFLDCEEALLAANVEISEDLIPRQVSIMKSSKQCVTADYKRVKGVVNNLIICACNVFKFMNNEICKLS
jgi:hypothetical protein